MRLPDTHAHLDAGQFDRDRDDVVARAETGGVSPILAVGSDLGSSRKAVGLAARYPHVFAAVGLHPHDADRFVEEADDLESLLCERKVVAVGEIGLDFARDGSNRRAQVDAFQAQLWWAQERRLPVSVHSRGAERAVLRCLHSVHVVAVLHCFGGDRDTAGAALDLGCVLSFAGNVTFPRASALRDVARHIPTDRVLVESDAPVLAPQSHRGRRNEPAYVRETAMVLARERGQTDADFARGVNATASRVFGWSCT